MRRSAQECTEVHRSSQDFTRVHRTSQDFTGVHRSSQKFTEVHRGVHRSSHVHRIHIGQRRNAKEQGGGPMGDRFVHFAFGIDVSFHSHTDTDFVLYFHTGHARGRKRRDQFIVVQNVPLRRIQQSQDGVFNVFQFRCSEKNNVCQEKNNKCLSGKK